MAFQTVIAADVNNDGDPDLVASQAFTLQPVAAVWLGSTGNAFTHAGDVELNTFSRALVGAVADVDADGFKDLIVASQNRTIVRRGFGNGTFPEETVYGDGGGGSVFVRDVNSDQLPDIVANQAIQFARIGSGSFTVLLNLGKGVFKSAPTISLEHGTKDVTTANLNGDQLKDIVVVTRGSGAGPGAIYVFFQQAAAGFASSVKEPNVFSLGSVGVDAFSVTTGTFDGDNLNDIVVVGDGVLGAPQNAMFLRNLGNNNFSVHFSRSDRAVSTMWSPATLIMTASWISRPVALV
jgi:hypothetical protein